ncbi:DUF4192 domain-containing protein [Oerskovia enterophila]
MTTTIRARGPRELLAYVPFRLGYRPDDSAVLISLRAARGRVGLVARADLADLADLEHGPQVARTLVSHLCADGARRAVLVVYTDADLRAGGVSAARERAAVEHCREAAEDFLGDLEVWVVGPQGYSSLDCRDESCCPAAGRPLTDLESTQVGAHMVLAGAAVAPSRAHSFAIPVLEPALRRRAVRASARWRADREKALAVGGDAAARWRAGGLEAWRSAVAVVDRHPGGEAALPPALLGRLEAALESIPVRDAVLLSFAAGTEDVARLTATAVPGPQVEAGTASAIAAMVDPAVGLPPDPDVARRARAVLEAVVGAGRTRRQAPALTLLALLAWWEGDGGLAADRLGRALDADPAYRLALLVRSALEAGLAPGWARAEAGAAR